MTKSRKELDRTDTAGKSFDGKYGAEHELDHGPAERGSENHQESFSSQHHRGGTGDNEARQHTADWLGDHNADEQSQRGAQSLDHLLGIAKPKDPDEHSYALPEHTAHEMDEREDEEPLEADLPVKRRGRR